MASVSEKWNASGAALTITPVIGPGDNACSYTSGQIQVCVYRDGTGPLGRGNFTNWSFEPDKVHIIGAIVQQCADSDPAHNCFGTSPATVRRILTHEVGHALGLAHPETVPSGDRCSVISTTCYSESPNNHDYEMLRAMYAHSDDDTSTTTSSSAPPSPGGSSSRTSRCSVPSRGAPPPRGDPTTE